VGLIFVMCQKVSPKCRTKWNSSRTTWISHRFI